ncbi:hypothetical protein SAY87_022052 [Trapa incisa]|uniref:Uncharacterized protein n=1 Tax=Trapa incisa TaxID=236973 RepID=A0AAN7JUC3_9MYRT|nr:hypothetical protein SAY87_022052 [Trapa incisa]
MASSPSAAAALPGPHPCPFSLASSPTMAASNFRKVPWRSQAVPKQSSLVSSLPGVHHPFDSMHETRLEEVKSLLIEMTLEKKGSSLESLEMLDALYRLGIAYRFEEEIRSILQEHHYHHHHRPTMSTGGHGTSSLYEVALRFRLLRQEGYLVPAEMFEGFKNKDNNNGSGESTFDPDLQKDIMGLTSLYEASHLGMQGEDILDEAAIFSKKALISWEDQFLDVGNCNFYSSSSSNSEEYLRELMKNTLSNPFHMSLPRFTAKNFRTNLFRGSYKWIEPFKKLAALDSNLVASANRHEILQITSWWRDPGLANEVKLARDQPVKWYIWPMIMLTDPKLSQERIDLTKSIAMVYVIDDIFDVYGSIDDLTLFTEAIKRWESMEGLPDHMKGCFRALDDITNEICSNIYEKHGWNPTRLLRKSWEMLCEAFLVEARWLTTPNAPSTVEYLNNAIVTTGVPVVMAHSFANLSSEGISDQILTGVLDGSSRDNILEISRLTGKILRLWDDLGSAKVPP